MTQIEKLTGKHFYHMVCICFFSEEYLGSRVITIVAKGKTLPLGAIKKHLTGGCNPIGTDKI